MLSKVKRILNNFISIYCFIAFIIGAMFMLVTLCIAAMGKVEEPINNVHFYVAKDKNGKLWLYINKPIRAKDVFVSAINIDLSYRNCNYIGLNKNDYADLKWDDEPIEVFINMED